jgi:putative FmdB family regulatory protein
MMDAALKRRSSTFVAYARDDLHHSVARARAREPPSWKLSRTGMSAPHGHCRHDRMLKSNKSRIRGRGRPRHTFMPLYEYQCKKCGHRFERIQRFSDPLVKKCPECGGKVEQLLSAPAVQFKGSGWYVTDYPKKPAGGSAAKSESSDGKGDTAKDSKDSGSKKDNKPKAEPASKSSDKK